MTAQVIHFSSASPLPFAIQEADPALNFSRLEALAEAVRAFSDQAAVLSVKTAAVVRANEAAIEALCRL